MSRSRSGLCASMIAGCFSLSIYVDSSAGGPTHTISMPFFSANSFIRVNSSTVEAILPSDVSGYPQMCRTPYRARYFKCTSLVGFDWHPSFISTGLPAAFALEACTLASKSLLITAAAAADPERNLLRSIAHHYHASIEKYPSPIGDRTL